MKKVDDSAKAHGDRPAFVTIPLDVQSIERGATALLEAGVLGDEIGVTPAIRLAVLQLLEQFVPQDASEKMQSDIAKAREKLLRSR